MSRNQPDLRKLRAPEGLEMIAAMRRSVVEALRDHKREDRSIVTWDRATGRIIEVPPGEIVVPDELDGIEGSGSKSDR